MKITLLDNDTLGAGLDFSVLKKFGEVRVCGNTEPCDVEKNIGDSDIVLINKIKLGEDNLKNNNTLKLICIFATGFDNVDVEYCKKKGIAVCNVVGYSTDSVAQLTVLMALKLTERLDEFTEFVTSGGYTKSGLQNYLEPVYHEVSGKTWGIIGFGNIGGKVAKIAEALGCRVIVNKRKPIRQFPRVSVEEICRKADIISIHTPLTEETRGMINAEKINLMKKNAILINVARGAVTDERAVANALKEGRIGGFGCDVYSAEPFPEEHPFNEIMHMKNVCLTPHMAWGAYEARVRCLDEIVLNIESFLKKEKRNRVD